jgi:hypothetical protein
MDHSMINKSKTTFYTTALIIGIMIQIYNLLYILEYLDFYGYLPQPFISDKNDTFMDFFHVIFWANDEGRYTEWRSVYPPLVFYIINKLNHASLSIPFQNGFQLRAENGFIIIFYIIFSILSLSCVFFSGIYKEYRKENLFLMVFFGLSPIYLFSLERGNIITICLGIVSLIMIVPVIYQAFLIAILINIKPYFILLSFAFVLKSQFRWLILNVVFSALIFLVVGFSLDSNFIEFLNNLFLYSTGILIYAPESISSMSSSLTVFSYIERWNQINNHNVFFPYQGSDYFIMLIGAVVYGAILLLIISLIKNRNRMTQSELLVYILLILINLSYTFGGYVMIFYACMIPVFSRCRLSIFLIAIVYLIMLPLDQIVISSQAYYTMFSYISSSTVATNLNIGLGSIMRPLLNLLILFIGLIELNKWDENIYNFIKFKFG